MERRQSPDQSLISPKQSTLQKIIATALSISIFSFTPGLSLGEAVAAEIRAPGEGTSGSRPVSAHAAGPTSEGLSAIQPVGLSKLDGAETSDGTQISLAAASLDLTPPLEGAMELPFTVMAAMEEPLSHYSPPASEVTPPPSPSILQIFDRLSAESREPGPMGLAAGHVGTVARATVSQLLPGATLAGFNETDPINASAAIAASRLSQDWSRVSGANGGRLLRPAVPPAPVSMDLKAFVPSGIEPAVLGQLNAVLRSMGLNDTLRILRVTRQVNPDRPTVVISASISEGSLTLLKSANVRSPGDVHLAIPGGLITKTGIDGKQITLLEKGFTFDEHGKPVIVYYDAPRIVRTSLDLSSGDRENSVNHQLALRLKLAQSGLPIPKTLAFISRDKDLPYQAGYLDSIDDRISVLRWPEGAVALGQAIKTFATGDLQYRSLEVRVEGSNDVRQFDATEMNDLFDYVSEKRATGLTLIISRVSESGPRRRVRESRDTETMDVRVMAVHAPWGGASVGLLTIVTDSEGRLRLEPFAALERTLRTSGMNARDLAVLHSDLENLGARAINVLKADSVQLDVKINLHKGMEVGHRLPTLRIVDVRRNGVEMFGDLNRFDPSADVEAARLLGDNLLEEARLATLRGKRIVVIGAGSEVSKKAYLQQARDLGIKIVMVSAGYTGWRRIASIVLSRIGLMKDSWARGMVDEFIPIDLSHPSQAVPLAVQALRRSVQRNGPIDGIMCYWEDDMNTAAKIAEATGLRFHSVETAKLSRNKFYHDEVMQIKGVPTLRSRLIELNDLDGMNLSETQREEIAVNRLTAELDSGIFRYPLVIKPVGGAEAIGSIRAEDRNDAIAKFKARRKRVDPDYDLAFVDDRNIEIQEYALGNEFDVNAVLQGGKVIDISVTDNHEPRSEELQATGSNQPSRLSSQDQQRIEERGTQIAEAMGIQEGVIHFEGKINRETSDIFFFDRAIRPGGGGYVTPWVKEVTGVDLERRLFMIATGIPLTSIASREPLTYLFGRFINPRESGIFWGIEEEAMRILQQHPSFGGIKLQKKKGSRYTPLPNGDDRGYFVYSAGKNLNQAERNYYGLKGVLPRVTIIPLIPMPSWIPEKVTDWISIAHWHMRSHWASQPSYQTIEQESD